MSSWLTMLFQGRGWLQADHWGSELEDILLFLSLFFSLLRCLSLCLCLSLFLCVCVLVTMAWAALFHHHLLPYSFYLGAGRPGTKPPETITSLSLNCGHWEFYFNEKKVTNTKLKGQNSLFQSMVDWFPGRNVAAEGHRKTNCSLHSEQEAEHR